MTRNSYRKVFSFSLSASLIFGLVGCGGSGDGGGGDGGGGDDETSSPTPTAQDTTYRVTSMRFGACDPDAPSSCEGLDLDGDGTVDNNFEATLAAMETILLEELDLAMDEAGIPATGADCPDGDGDGSPDQCVTQQQVLAQLEPALESLLSIEAWSEALDAGIQSGDLNYLFDFQAAGGGETVVWYSGTFEEVGISRGGTIGSQTDEDGDALYGPGDLTLTITRTLPDGTSFSLPLKTTATLTKVDGRSDTAVSGLTLGGAVRIEDMLVVLQQLVDYINALNDQGGVEVPGPITPEIEEELMIRASAAIAPFADIDLDADGEAGEAVDIDGDGTEDGDPDDGVSTGLLGAAGAITVLE